VGRLITEKRKANPIVNLLVLSKNIWGRDVTPRLKHDNGLSLQVLPSVRALRSIPARAGFFCGLLGGKICLHHAIRIVEFYCFIQVLTTYFPTSLPNCIPASLSERKWMPA
jgi:hypothetical protein